MKKQLFTIAIIALSLIFSSCKKEDPTPVPAFTPPASTQLFMTFDLDGTTQNITGSTNSLNTGYGGGSYTSSGFFNLNTDIDFTLSMPLDSIMGSDLQALVGQKLLIGSCGGCPTNIHLSYDIGGNSYQSYDTYNPAPTNYVRFNSVTYLKTSTSFGITTNQYLVEGDFNLKLSYGSTVKNATNGTFRLIFKEAKH